MLTYNPDSPTPDGGDLSPGQLAQARAISYDLFGRLFLEGITAELSPYIQTVPALTAVLPSPFDLDEAAAVHHTLFSFNIFPYAALFLTEEGLPGGETANQLLYLYQQAGYVPESSFVAADHLGHQLGFLAFLADAEAEAQQSQPEIVSLWQKRQHYFLEAHLLPWLLPCLVAVEQADSPFFATIAQLTYTLVLTHFAELSSAEATSPPAVDNTAEKPRLLADDRTGLREIAHFLLTPCLSGLFLSSQAVGSMARQLDLPRGFGNREQVLLNLVRTAVQYEALPLLLNHLTQSLDDWRARYAAIERHFPQSGQFLRPWCVRLDQTQQLLTSIMQQSQAIQSS
jgi:TorA maturation chaperone TorD